MTRSAPRALFLSAFVAFAAFAPASAGPLRRIPVAHGETCAALTNKGTFFTVDIAVGTPIDGAPAQIFSVVADTGSNNVIVPSCLCHTAGNCYQRDRCFTGTKHSSTFHVQGAGAANAPAVTLTFGSGTISAIIASDVAHVGNLSATLEESLLLMYGHKLDFGGSFEGILGLGIPGEQIIDSGKSAGPSSSDSSSSEGSERISNSDQEATQDVIKRIIDQMTNALNPYRGIVQNQIAVGRPEDTSVGGPSGKAEVLSPKSFLEVAGVDRFSMCFNEQTDGVLRLGTPVLNNPLSSAGVFHWGLDFRGFRVGKTSKPVVCDLEDMRPNQETPCGFIPDSGTTNILGPKDQVRSVLEAVCDGWARCREKFIAMSQEGASAAPTENMFLDTSDKFDEKASGIKKTDVLDQLLAGCGSWLSEGQGIRELPTLHLGVGGGTSSGALQTVELTGWSYVVEHSDQSETVCRHAFGVMEYETEKNGPVWILGTPLFYTYRVDYDVATSPPSMSFTKLDDEPCTPCGKEAALMSQQEAAGALRSVPRMVWGEPRVPVIDTTQAL